MKRCSAKTTSIVTVFKKARMEYRGGRTVNGDALTTIFLVFELRFCVLLPEGDSVCQ